MKSLLKLVLLCLQSCEKLLNDAVLTYDKIYRKAHGIAQQVLLFAVRVFERECG